MNVNVGVNQAMDARALKLAEPEPYEPLTETALSIFEVSNRIGFLTTEIKARLFGSKVADETACKSNPSSLEDVLHEIRSGLHAHVTDLEIINNRIGV